MPDVPDCLSLKRHRDLEGMNRSGIWVRRVVLTLIAVLAVLALANVFGQRPSTLEAEGAAAVLEVYSPTDIRGGDFMEARFHITAKRDLKKAVLKLDPGWAEGMSMNTIEPSPVDETSEDGRLAFTLGPIAAGHSYILFLQFQVNPTNVAWHRPQNVDLYDGNQVVARIHKTITVYP
jgi:hypothetical protein